MSIQDDKTPAPDPRSNITETLNKWDRLIIIALVCIGVACILACSCLKYLVDLFRF